MPNNIAYQLVRGGLLTDEEEQVVREFAKALLVQTIRLGRNIALQEHHTGDIVNIQFVDRAEEATQ